MTFDDLSGDLRAWAQAKPEGRAPSLDRSSDSALRGLRQALSRPMEIEAVERLETLAKSLWFDVLSGPPLADKAASFECARFFQSLGFLFKYKPYGLKMASPFGYTVFDLNDGAGFSFQLHQEPKLEAFHIIRRKSQSLAYISSPLEWAEQGKLWATEYFDGDEPADVAFVARPADGDVIEIAETGIVHSVLGCVLEEYASCSVDAVERLFDQNRRASVELPSENPNPADVLGGSHAGLPAKRLSRTSYGWDETPIAADEAIISVEGELIGARRWLAADDFYQVAPTDDMVTLLVACAGPIEVSVEDSMRTVPVGEYSLLLPGMAAKVAAAQTPTALSIHQVSTESVFADWTK